LNSKIGELKPVNFDEDDDFSSFGLRSEEENKSLGSGSSKSVGEGEDEGEGEGEGEEGEEGEEDEVEGEEGKEVELQKKSSREERMEWKKQKFRPGTLKRRIIEDDEDDEDEEDNEAHQPEPVKNKKISPADAEQVTSNSFFPHVHSSFFVSVMIESKIDIFVSILIDTNIHIFMSFVIIAATVSGKRNGERASKETTCSSSNEHACLSIRRAGCHS
jgi:hypothetical protein